MITHALATIERGAVGNHALGINAALHSAGISVETYAETIVETYAETIRPEFQSSVKDIEEFASEVSPNDVGLYQFANQSPSS